MEDIWNIQQRFWWKKLMLKIEFLHNPEGEGMTSPCCCSVLHCAIGSLRVGPESSFSLWLLDHSVMVGDHARRSRTPQLAVKPFSDHLGSGLRCCPGSPQPPCSQGQCVAGALAGWLFGLHNMFCPNLLTCYLNKMKSLNTLVKPKDGFSPRMCHRVSSYYLVVGELKEQLLVFTKKDFGSLNQKQS